jgi:predicted methyltransferase
MYRYAFAAAVALTLTAAPAFSAGVPDYVAAAVADKDRPKDDTDRDVNRHPADIMAMTGVKPGDRVVDVGPGKTGYYTRILARIVGKDGKVYMFNPTWVADKFPQVKDGPTAFAAAGFTNVEGVIQPMAEIKFDKPVDLVFMSQIYHDQVWQKVDIAKMNKAIFDALKPGGVFFIVDHAGPGVTTPEQIDKLHRIDGAEVKKQVLAAGFVLETESDILKNAGDPHTANVFDASIRGKTDQFVYKFKKPAK